MDADFVVDVGNSRIKWGRCHPSGGIQTFSLPTLDPEAWQRQYDSWKLSADHCWVIAGVNPVPRKTFLTWLSTKGQKTCLLDSARQLPLVVRLDEPDQVGIDRLLNAVAVNTRRHKDRPAILIDAGSAVTVDWLDREGAFCGGAIFPGFRLMARTLHRDTALLPLVQITSAAPALPGKDTREALQAGIFWSVVGGINILAARLAGQGQEPAHVFLAGGDAALLAPYLEAKPVLWPEITLEGIRLAAKNLGVV